MTPNTVTLDRYSRIILTLLMALVAVLVIELAALRPSTLEPVCAQVPDSGHQRNMQIDEQRRTNELLRSVLDRLTDGPVPVRVVAGEAPKPNKGGK